MSDRRKTNRNEQRRARELAEREGISYMRALNQIRQKRIDPDDSGLAGDRSALTILFEQCENVLGRRGTIGGMYSQRPSREQLVGDAFGHAHHLLAARVGELAPREPTWHVADAAKMLAGAALAALDPGGAIATPRQLADLVRRCPSQVPWWGLPPSELGTQDRRVGDTHEWWARVDDLAGAVRLIKSDENHGLNGIGVALTGDRDHLISGVQTDGGEDHQLQALLRLAVEYAYWSESGDGDLP